MSERCDDLDQFFDRELGTEAAQAFRDHLAACGRCQRSLHGRMLEAAVVAGDQAEHPPVSGEHAVQTAVGLAPEVHEPGVAGPGREATIPTDEPPIPLNELLTHRARRLFKVIAVSIVAAAAAMLLLHVGIPATGGSGPDLPTGDHHNSSQAQSITYSMVVRKLIGRVTDDASDGLLALASERGVEVRFSAPALDHYRKYTVVRAADAAPHEQITLQRLAELEQLGQLNTLVGALALNGDLASAERRATELPHTAQSLADRAALELLRRDSAPDHAGRPTQDAAADRALSLATDALRRDPACAQARWNQAIALERLGLSLVAVRVFDEIARSHETGWSDEARGNAERLRRADQRDASAWDRLTKAADQMVLGGRVLTENDVSSAPSVARDAFYKALATASTLDRIDALAPLARALDARFTTTALRDLLARVRASDLAARAPFAAELRAFIELHKPRATINDLRARAVKHGVPDIALASFLVIAEGETEAEDLTLLDSLVASSGDPWWKIFRLARHAFISEFRDRDYPAVDTLQRLAAPICETTHSTLCGRITLFAGGANSQMGRADLAIQQITAAQRLAKDAAMRDDEVAAIHALGQAISIRVADDVDSSAVAGAYLEEVSLRLDVCSTRLQRLDFAANAALQYHRFDEAARYRDDADGLERGTCHDSGLRLNGETARLRLVLRGRPSLETLRASLKKMASEGRANRKLYLDFLGAAATLAEDRQRGELALRQVIAAANADPRRAYAPLVRSSAFDVLVESAAGSGDAKAVLALLAERLRAPSYDHCVLAIASWNRLVVAMLDAGGLPALETREVPEGVVMIPPSEVVPPGMRSRLAACRRIEVLTAAPYFGAPKLLGDSVAWVYHSGTPRPAQPQPTGSELVVSDVTPPISLHLPALQPFSGGDGAKILSGPDATPEHVLAAMKTASLIVIVAHGLTDASEPTAASLILSPDPQGDYLLTASKVSSIQLTAAPTVVLAGCDAGRVQVSAEPWSLATSLIAAGARVVIAPTEPIPDASASEVFRSLVERIRAGTDPLDALVAERSSRGTATPWLSSIVVFE